jgi:hypothetical protein
MDSENLSSLYNGKQKFMTEYISEGEGVRANNAFFDMIHDRAASYDACKIVDWYL